MYVVSVGIYSRQKITLLFPLNRPVTEGGMEGITRVTAPLRECVPSVMCTEVVIVIAKPQTTPSTCPAVYALLVVAIKMN